MSLLKMPRFLLPENISTSTDGRSTIVLTVNARFSDRALHGGGERGAQRRTDFEALASSLNADVVDWSVADSSRLWRTLRRKVGFGPVAAALVFLRRHRYQVIWCFTEVEGLLLATLFKLFRTRRVVFMIGIETLSPKAFFLLKRLRVWTHFTAILPTSTYQAGELQKATQMPPDKVIVLPYQVDCRYFSGASSIKSRDGRPYVAAAGLESRDYSTLISAIEGLDVDLRLAVASLWSGRGGPRICSDPPRIVVGSYSYADLRRLYAGATLAVVPLNESPYQHGITALQEAMAMGLPVIVTRTVGQSDVVVDRRKVLRSDPDRETQGGFARMFAPDKPELQESNGFYVGVGDVTALRNTISYILEEESVAYDLGKRAQRFAQAVLSLELFVERARLLIQTASAGRRISTDILTDTYTTYSLIECDLGQD
jgi:glycosyltransferase involved in cell wall biosynthesis